MSGWGGKDIAPSGGEDFLGDPVTNRQHPLWMGHIGSDPQSVGGVSMQDPPAVIHF